MFVKCYDKRDNGEEQGMGVLSKVITLLYIPLREKNSYTHKADLLMSYYNISVGLLQIGVASHDIIMIRGALSNLQSAEALCEQCAMTETDMYDQIADLKMIANNEIIKASKLDETSINMP